MADVASQIDDYLKGKGSPLAGYGNVFAAAGRKYGVDPKLVVAISGAESGFGKYLFRPNNAWGWGGQTFADWAEGISTVTSGLRSGYLARGLNTPAKIVRRYAPASDGNDEAQWASNVETFMRELGASPGSSTVKSKAAAKLKSGQVSPVPANPVANMSIPGITEPDVNAIAGESLRYGGGTASLRSVVDQLAGFTPLQLSTLQAPTPTPPPSPPPPPPRGAAPPPSGAAGLPASGKLIGTPHAGTHTLGNWESDNAVDISLPLGTPVRAVADGTIGSQFGSLGRGGRFAGLRLHLATAGNEFYYGHLSSFAPGVRPGARVKAGQIIGYSGEANGVPHLHFAERSGNPTTRFKA